MHVAVGLQLLEMSSITKLNLTISNVCTGTFFRVFFKEKKLEILLISNNEKKFSMVIACKWNRFHFWNLYKRLQNFVNVEALQMTDTIQ